MVTAAPVLSYGFGSISSEKASPADEPVWLARGEPPLSYEAMRAV
jgi:hypothetical protein